MIVKRMKVEKLEIDSNFGPSAHLQAVKEDGKREFGSYFNLKLTEQEQQALHLGQVLEVTVALPIVERAAAAEEATHV